MTHKVAKVIQAAIEWYEAYEKYAKTPSDGYDFALFASQTKLLSVIREYKGDQT